MDKPLISILITNYNTVEFVKLSLFALEKLTYNSYQVLVNDNGSNENNITELKNLENNKEYLKVNYRQSKYKEASFAHAEALNILIDMVDTKYFIVLDSDCVLLLKNWDQQSISELNETVKIIGTQIASLKGTGHKPDDFPFQFCETETYKKLNISCMPENTTTKDTCWEWKPKYLDASKLFYAKEYQDVYCAEYYTEDGKLICNHFGRGSSGGVAKYNNKWWFKIYRLKRKKALD